MTAPHNESSTPLKVEMNGPIWLKLRMEVPAENPESLLRWFTDPDLLARWMGDEHTIDLVPGGRYTIHWARADRTMNGSIIVVRPTEIVFSWAFAHEPDAPARVVMVQTHTADDGSHSIISLIHGPYRNEVTDPAVSASEAAERQGHLEGWNAFLPLLLDQVSMQAGVA